MNNLAAIVGLIGAVVGIVATVLPFLFSNNSATEVGASDDAVRLVHFQHLSDDDALGRRRWQTRFLGAMGVLWILYALMYAYFAVQELPQSHAKSAVDRHGSTVGFAAFWFAAVFFGVQGKRLLTAFWNVARAKGTEPTKAMNKADVVLEGERHAVFNRCKEALRRSRASIVEISFDDGFIRARKPYLWYGQTARASFLDEVTVQLTPLDGNRYQVHVESDGTKPTFHSDRERNHANVSRFMHYLIH